MYVLFNGVPSIAQKVMIGIGASPRVDQAAIDKYVLYFPVRVLELAEGQHARQHLGLLIELEIG